MMAVVAIDAMIPAIDAVFLNHVLSLLILNGTIMISPGSTFLLNPFRPEYILPFAFTSRISFLLALLV